MNVLTQKLAKVFTAIAVLAMLLQIPATYAGDFEDKYKDDLKDTMNYRKEEIVGIYDDLRFRITAMNAEDPKKKAVDDVETDGKTLMDLADDAKNAFKDIDVDNQIAETGVPTRPYAPSEHYQELEQAAISAFNTVNQTLIRPGRPAAVPQGDIKEDFIPSVIRLLFRFVYLVILVVFIVSGIMLITSMEDEEKITKAKRMIYYAVMGFGIVTLAFAVVKAITDIDFFGFI